MIGNVVAFAGMIGFLGLVVPHLVRMLVNTNLYVVLPIASVGGAILLVFFDAPTCRHRQHAIPTLINWIGIQKPYLAGEKKFTRLWIKRKIT